MEGIQNAFTEVRVKALPKPGQGVTSKSEADKVLLKGKLILHFHVWDKPNKPFRINLTCFKKVIPLLVKSETSLCYVSSI